MISIKQIILILIVFVFQCCSNPAPNKNDNTSAPTPSAKLLIIDLQPFSDISEKQVAYIRNELSKIYPNILTKKAIPLPAEAFYKKRNRYRADTIINILRKTTPLCHVTIGLTNKDISNTKGQIEDYGIMGLGFQPGASCVVSTFRLSKQNLLPQFFKLAIHELGHTQGLPHCPDKTCFMRDAEGKNHADEETDFCFKCKAHLVSKGWTFRKNRI